MFLQDFMAKKRFLHILAPFLECKKGIFFKVVAKWGKCKKNHFFCRNGLYPCWYKIYQEAMRFWKLFGILVHPNHHPIIIILSATYHHPIIILSSSYHHHIIIILSSSHHHIIIILSSSYYHHPIMTSHINARDVPS